MCAAEGMGIAPWGALGSGKFKSAEQREHGNAEGRNFGEVTEKDIKISNALEEIANAKSTSITSVALAYVLHKAPYVFPIVGGRKIEHLKGNIEALELELSEENIAKIEGAADFDIGFPLNFLSRKPGGAKGPGDVWLSDLQGVFDYVETPKVGFCSPFPHSTNIFLRKCHMLTSSAADSPAQGLLSEYDIYIRT